LGIRPSGSGAVVDFVAREIAFGVWQPGETGGIVSRDGRGTGGPDQDQKKQYYFAEGRINDLGFHVFLPKGTGFSTVFTSADNAKFKPQGEKRRLRKKWLARAVGGIYPESMAAGVVCSRVCWLPEEAG
jgi:hypothetical protein